MAVVDSTVGKSSSRLNLGCSMDCLNCNVVVDIAVVGIRDGTPVVDVDKKLLVNLAWSSSVTPGDRNSITTIIAVISDRNKIAKPTYGYISQF